MALDRARPSVIALDFDLRSPSPSGQPVEVPEYQRETEFLLETLKTVSSRGTTIVLPRTLAFQEDSYITESDIYNGFEFGNSQISTGFIVLPDDVRSVPLEVTLGDGSRIDSFAVAAVRAYRRIALEGIESKDSIYPYATYLRPEAFSTVTSSEILKENFEADLLRSLRGAGESAFDMAKEFRLE